EPGREVLLTREEEKLLDLINRERSKKHLPPLKVDAQLTRVARLKSEDMLENGYFGHSSPTYGKLGDMLKEEGIQYRYAAENIGRGGTVENVHGMMMDSSVHRNAILGRRYTLVGLGVVRTSRGGVIVTEIFVGR
ncbi:MAG: SCP-like extracellular protein, partial [Clostridia bacterium]|nr:SCP-like extracellular protein [Clostridia bacterium]